MIQTTSRLFIISNRLPVTILEENDTVKYNLSSGGLISAMSSYLQYAVEKGTNNFSEIFWAGVPGCSAANWQKVADTIQGDYNYLPVFVNNQVYNSYYNGMSNSVIWPLFHYFPSYADYHSKYYQNYLKANDDFFNVIIRTVKEEDTVWIHDYHLLPLAGMLRNKFPAITIGFFLHIPFPSYELFRLMPNKWQEEILEGMLGADLIGFQTIDYASHFMKCIQMILGVEIDKTVIRYKGRLIKIDAFPISIDYNKYHNAFNIKEVALLRENYHEQFAGKKILFSVDRLDYTKCVMCRLKSYEHFLKIYPEYLEKVVFILNIVPSRDKIQSYISRKREIDEFIGSFNARVGNLRWKPVLYQYGHLDFTELMALYTACDLALITPLRDGMNLVAKEFVASRMDKKGVLLLSEMTGAARELTDALMINPNDSEGIAMNIKRGLEMPASEQGKRIESMQKRIKSYDINTWAEDFLSQLGKIKKQQTEFEFQFLDNASRLMLFEKYSTSSKRLLLLDYDGTLVPFSSLPKHSAPDEKVLEVISMLAKDPHNDIYIISGRDSTTLQEWLGHLDINLIAEHGAKTKHYPGEWRSELPDEQDMTWKNSIIRSMESYVKRCANTFIEEKEHSVVWHYRNAYPDQAKIRSAELLSELTAVTPHLNLQVVPGNKIVEVRMKGTDKGVITKKIIKDNNYDFILACGDDNTDEDMFQVLAGCDHAYTIKIGDVASYAKYNLYTPQMTISLLEFLANTHPV